MHDCLEMFLLSGREEYSFLCFYKENVVLELKHDAVCSACKFIITKCLVTAACRLHIMSSMNQKSAFIVIWILEKKFRFSWISWNKLKTRELLYEWPHTKHPVRYFPGQNEMNREEKIHSGMDVCQYTNFKGLLSYPCSTCRTKKTQINTVSILGCQFAKPKGWKHLRKFRMKLGLHDCSELR